MPKRTAQRGQRDTPPIGHPLQRDVLGKSMASNMPLWDRIPRPVFDGNPGLVTDGFEAHFDFGRLLRWKACLAPTEDEALAGFPDRDATDLERVSVVELGNEAASGPGLKS